MFASQIGRKPSALCIQALAVLKSEGDLGRIESTGAVNKQLRPAASNPALH